jgi:hypothetical protein
VNEIEAKYKESKMAFLNSLDAYSTEYEKDVKKINDEFLADFLDGSDERSKIEVDFAREAMRELAAFGAIQARFSSAVVMLNLQMQTTIAQLKIAIMRHLFVPATPHTIDRQTAVERSPSEAVENELDELRARSNAMRANAKAAEEEVARIIEAVTKIQTAATLLIKMRINLLYHFRKAHLPMTWSELKRRATIEAGEAAKEQAEDALWRELETALNEIANEIWEEEIRLEKVKKYSKIFRRVAYGDKKTETKPSGQSALLKFVQSLREQNQLFEELFKDYEASMRAFEAIRLEEK